MSVSCSNYPLPLVMKNILTDRFNGELLIRSKNLIKCLHFFDGDLIFASSDVFDERLGVLLYLLGMINDQQYDFISGLAHSVDQKVGEILIQNNFISEEDLYYATLFQMKKIAVNAFAIDMGDWEMKRKTSDISQKLKYRNSLLPIVSEGARKIENVSFFVKKIQFLAPETTDVPEPIIKLMTDDEKTLYQGIQACQRMSNREIISRLNLEPTFYWKKMVMFILLDIIDFYEHESEYDILENIPRLIEFQKKLQAGNPDYFEILGVSESASKADIEVAYNKLLDIFNPNRFGSAAAPEIKNIARYVCEKIENAYQILTEGQVAGQKKISKTGSEEVNGLDEFDFQKDHIQDIHIDIEKEIADQESSPFQKAEKLYQEQQYAEAAKILKPAIKSEPKNGDYYCLLGLCQTHLEFFQEEAERHLKRAIELNPWSSDAVYALGILLGIQGKKKQAAKCFERVMSMTANHDRAAEALRELAQRKKKKASLFSFLKKEIKKK